MINLTPENIALATIFAVVGINIIALIFAFLVTISADVRWDRYGIFNGVYKEAAISVTLVGGTMVCVKMIAGSCLHFCIYGVTHHMVNLISCPILMYIAYGHIEYSMSILLTYMFWPKSRNGMFTLMSGEIKPLHTFHLVCLMCTMFALIVINIVTFIFH